MVTAYTPDEWNNRHIFVDLLTSACHNERVAISWLADGWMAQLSKHGREQFIVGYLFPLNNAVSAAIVHDKSATALLLNQQGIACIPHQLVWLSKQRDITHALAMVQKLTQLPLVLKPNSGESSGFDVHLCRTPAAITTALGELSMRHRAIAVSPFIDFEREFRVVMCDKTPLLVFAKIRAADEWRHNLKLGATPQVVKNPAVIKELSALAADALHALGARLGAVDIAQTADGYQIMEVNGGISLTHFSQYSADYRKIAEAVYTAIVRQAMN